MHKSLGHPEAPRFLPAVRGGSRQDNLMVFIPAICALAVFLLTAVP